MPDDTPSTPKTALDGAYDRRRSVPGSRHERAEASRQSRAPARVQPRGSDPGTYDERIKSLERQLATLGGRNIKKDGNVLTAGPEKGAQEINLNVIWNGQMSVIAVRARTVS
jgi:hypothetical protein